MALNCCPLPTTCIYYQHGFRQKHSCESHLILTVDDLVRGVKDRKQTDVLILDFSKAFDKVAHQHLLQKLNYCGIRGDTLTWISTWLTKRKQHVVIDGERSTEVTVASGVPQGTVLGPLMFLIYINDIGNDLTSQIKLFADDCLIYK